MSLQVVEVAVPFRLYLWLRVAVFVFVIIRQKERPFGNKSQINSLFLNGLFLALFREE
jgi:hypothetical protein